MTIGYIYAIDGGDAVKIGWSGDPRRRFYKVRSDNPSAIGVIGFIAATLVQEKALHGLLAPWRIRHEWYRKEGAVVVFLGSLPPILSRGISRYGNHPLAMYLDEQRLSARALALRIGVPTSTITRVLNGQRTPGLHLMHRIQQATAGAVRSDDFVPSMLERRGDG